MNNSPFNIFIHKFLKSDPDDLHDHPWGFTTFILGGGYWEYTSSNVKTWYGPFSYRSVKNPEFLHRIQLDKNIPYCWTLFIPGKRVKDWGFDTEKGWVQHEQYLVEKKKTV